MKSMFITSSQIVIFNYLIFAIVRSIASIVLKFNLNEFPDLNSNVKEATSNFEQYVLIFYILPYVVGLLIILLLKRFFNLSWRNYLVTILIGAILFRLIDTAWIRPLFRITENSLYNNLIIIGVFSCIGYLLGIRFNKLNLYNNLRDK